MLARRLTAFEEARRVLDALLRQFIRKGSLAVVWPNGRRGQYGKQDGREPSVAVRLIGRLTPLKLALHPDLFLGETYMDGSLRVERGTLWDLLELLGRNLPILPDGRLSRIWRPILNQVTQRNSRRLSRRNVARHYDLSYELYRLFLDHDLQYSCAYFARPDLDLDAAQKAKKHHLVAKLQLQPGNRVLDIGCGWGGLALAMAQAEDVTVVGITLSREQLEVARQRAAQAGLSDRVSFELQDYRDVEGPVDRIVSVGMFEHVGVPHYAGFFKRVRELLSAQGIAILHSIGRMHGPSTTSHWIQRYIFPGGYIPSLSQVLPHVEYSSLWITDLEILRLHYANTLRLWRERFLLHRDVAKRIYDERFCRMWEFYLACSEMSFRYAGFMVFQMQLAADIDAVPLTRDYLFEAERRIQSFYHLPDVDIEVPVGGHSSPSTVSARPWPAVPPL